MAWEAPVQVLPFTAAIDMSSSGTNETTGAGQYRVMRSSASHFVRYQENSSGTIVGILQNAPVANEAASVVTYGVSKAWVTSTSADIAVGETVCCSTDGRVTAMLGAQSVLVGVALEPCSSSPMLISILLAGLGASNSTSSLFV